MGTFLGNTPDVSGVPIREVTPATLQSIFYHDFGDPIGDPFVIIPGLNSVLEAGAYGAWPLWTRSVVSWAILTTCWAGASLHIEIANQQWGGFLLFNTWRHFGLFGHHVTSNGTSGLELPSGVFARFTLLPGSYNLPDSLIRGSLTLRGV